MAFAAAAFAPGLFASPILLGLFCWPFLVVWVLWAAKRPEEAGAMAWLGAGLSTLALLGCSSHISWGQAVCLGLEACIAVIILAGRKGEAHSLNDQHSASFRAGMEQYVPLLVTGCIFMALLLRPPLAALFFDAAGTVLLAWWDGRATRRAMPAWEVVRLRLSGVVLASVGLMVMRGGSVFATADTALQVGQVFALTGLCMMAGLGHRASSRAELALLDVGLRFVPLFLLPLVMVTPLARSLMVLAGLLALGSVVLGKQGRVPSLTWVLGFAVLAAGTGQRLVLLWLYSAVLLAASLRVVCEREAVIRGEAGYIRLPPGGLAVLPMQMMLPLLMMVSIVLAASLGRAACVGLFICLCMGLRGLELESLPQTFLAVWRWHDTLIRLLLVLLGALTLLGIALLAMGLMPEPAIQMVRGVGR
ncbi:hypothetical protein [Bombella sp. ESL0385]|uniref:hypothetical protein n=1 Tax=Bombella sp. ESL0385 TaxID=2676446 RepID=UPI0012D90264|nr:hypothetical protein [Bombella sp. ESL0385]MUG90537.1 hypothetical protein [Bombella sp. ESL0385]